MILRINQIDPAAEAHNSGWPADGLAGPIEHPWPAGTNAFELFLLEQDETHQPIATPDRQRHLRLLIPRMVDALRSNGDFVVLRFDGPVWRGELGRVYEFAIDPGVCERYSFSAADRFDPAYAAPIGSVRVLPHSGRLIDLCSDEQIGLAGQVRLRAFALPEELVNPFLDTTITDDERWREIIPAAGFMLSTSLQLRSIHLFSRRFSAADLTQRCSNFV